MRAVDISAVKSPTRRPAAKNDPLRWWRESRFGLFIHWGLYAIPAGVWHGIMSGMLSASPTPELAGLGIPTLILSGERDAVFARPAQQALIAQLPRARSTIYAETGHAPHWERPERFAGDLVRFLREIGKAKGEG